MKTKATLTRPILEEMFDQYLNAAVRCEELYWARLRRDKTGECHDDITSYRLKRLQGHFQGKYDLAARLITLYSTPTE